MVSFGKKGGIPTMCDIVPRVRYAPVLALFAALAACSVTQQRSAETKLAEVLIPTEQENQLGLEVKKELEQKQGVEYVEDGAVNDYVQRVAGKILAHAKEDRPDVNWTVKVINDPKQVNAFATPGGYLYVYSGLILAADDTSELAGVLGHEAGHVIARHSARQMVDAVGLQALASVALGKDPNTLAQIAAGLAGQGALLAHSRADETEADEFGARYAAAAGYDPHGIATFFEKLMKGEGKQPGWARFLSTHPPSAERIERVNAYIAKHKLEGKGGKGGSEIAAVKAHLREIPPPRETARNAQEQGTGSAP
jgi:predicted Zn-dependent protease